ncbi:glycerophosphoryl diester phosphodiesterase [Chitinivorax tropicus]|uniref:Glycerophosphoryl diester phosphodiesterase n=1 Tax=Chitinivorax tropicus TaxID=714531 RepID=A0A840MN58_9PROT|nr:glycerophosphodiester phosphodiesterase [Chitinivorax tropicus]MBB5018539.1 glycerophosphoryl diester phosphodiesterase [Chitinivorax tropicus]
MHLLAHRGHHQTLPENTMEAFSSAMALGFEGIETDVRISRDQQLILFHNRVASNGCAVAELTRSELEVVTGFHVPTLEEALDAFPTALWNIEIKVAAAQASSIRVLKRYQHNRRLLITSFRHDIVLACAHELSTDCGMLIAHRPVSINSLAHAALPEPRLRTIVWDFEIVDVQQLEMANAIGFKNIVYGPHTASEHELCTHLGLHGLITDHPEFVELPHRGLHSLTKH